MVVMGGWGAQIILGVVPIEDKSFALGVQGFVYRLLGTIPAPIICMHDQNPVSLDWPLVCL
jgi:hypothetical protein